MSSVVTKISPSFSIKLNLARGLAAAVVMISHLRGHYFAPYTELSSLYHNSFTYCLFFITQLGHQAVIVFFVLSGYLVGGSILSEWMQGTTNWIKYFVNRITRMWTVLIPALLLGALFDFITFHLDPHTLGVENFTIKNFLGNIFFLQEIRVSTFGSNFALWSLASEFWYYLLWPVVFLIIGLKVNLWMKIAVLLISLAICFHLAPGAMTLFPIWVCGAIVRLVKDSSFFGMPAFKISTYLILLGTLLYSSITRSVSSYYMLGFAVCFLFIGWQYSKEVSYNQFIKKTSHFFSEFSFSLYAVHYFFIVLLLEVAKRLVWLPVRAKDASFANWSILILLVIVTYLWGFLFYWFTERHTYTIRNKILATLYGNKLPALKPSLVK